jgi:fructokinase
VGGGLAVRGELVAGANGLAGEWGHNPLPWPDEGEARLAPHCWCGRRNCIEAWLSGPALAADHARQGGEAMDAERIAARAAQGDPTCDASLQRHASRLARALAALINIVDPDVIVLGGGLSRMASLYARVPALWGAHVFGAGATLRTRLVASRHGDASGVRGAAWLWRGARR